MIWLWILAGIAVLLLLVLIAMLILKPYLEVPEITPPTYPSTQTPTTTALVLHYRCDFTKR